ncbi:coiled-coil domain-containing protein 137 [Thalassophryne amazonica]|uniref:coiled-coil domain-containing protein 137 n=1 Tax=Thalassophryne amazonica TaxID=390379 RepID=UPI0014722EA0|nr:coiled-coil domain-containing protein 137 [Thalassophryne amazonica]
MEKKQQREITKMEKQEIKFRKRRSDKKLKRDGKLKKTKQDDHLEHIPFRLREILRSQERMNAGLSRPKKQKGNAPKSKVRDSQDGEIPVPCFRRQKNENKRAYLQRMEDETKYVRFLSKNQMDRKPELDGDQQDMPANKRKSDKRKVHDRVKLLRLQQKKLTRQEAKMEKEMFVDNVPFGEVSMAPPSLSIIPKKAQLKAQKGAKNLLLNSLLGHTATSVTKPSMARKRIMEEERVHAVEAYRHLKKQKQQQHEARTAKKLL